MKYQETGFRALYKNFVTFPLNDRFRKAMEGYPNVDDANCKLVYGYRSTQLHPNINNS